MRKYLDADDVYQETSAAAAPNWLLGLLAFALFEEQRLEWMRHRREIANAAPSSEEIQAWYESQPQGAVARALVSAEMLLGGYGTHSAEVFGEDHRRQIADGVVVAEIRRLGRWGPQLGLNVMGGLIGSMVFTALLVLLGTFLLNGPSAEDFARQFTHSVEKGHVQHRNNP